MKGQKAVAPLWDKPSNRWWAPGLATRRGQIFSPGKWFPACGGPPLPHYRSAPTVLAVWIQNLNLRPYENQVGSTDVKRELRSSNFHFLLLLDRTPLIDSAPDLVFANYRSDRIEPTVAKNVKYVKVGVRRFQTPNLQLTYSTIYHNASLFKLCIPNLFNGIIRIK